jgi:cytoskeletal protein CcmA (bactofilin family)
MSLDNIFRKYSGQERQTPEPIQPMQSTPAPVVPEYRQPEPLPSAPQTPAYGGGYAQPVAAPRPAAAAPVASRNILSSDVEIKGTVKFTNDLVVDGKIEGEITSDGNLTVGENARIKAEIKTATVVVYGKVHGNLTASDRVELKASAEVVGDIKTKTLSIEAGAIFVGKSTVGTPTLSQAPAAKPAPAAAPAVQATAPAAAPKPAVAAAPTAKA